jgi:hypothetical protein
MVAADPTMVQRWQRACDHVIRFVAIPSAV